MTLYMAYKIFLVYIIFRVILTDGTVGHVKITYIIITLIYRLLYIIIKLSRKAKESQ